MALVLADRVKDITTSTGTGTITLADAPPAGFQSFAVIGNANTTYYTIAGGSQWEVGIGTYTASGTTLSRDTVLSSSSGGSLVAFSAGAKDVFVTYPAEESVYQDGAVIKAGTAILPVANGGTGATTLTANNVLLGNGTSALQAVAPGAAGNILTSNGTTWASTTPAPSGPALTAVASGSLSNGSRVIINANGTVSVVGGLAQVLGTASVFNATSGSADISSAYDVNAQKIVIAYRDSSTTFGVAIVGTVSGTSISFGTPVVFASAVSSRMAVVYDEAAQKVVIAHTNQFNFGVARVGTVSGTSITVGGATAFDAMGGYQKVIVYNQAQQKVVIAYKNGDSLPIAIVGTVSGTSISFGSPTTINSVVVGANEQPIGATYDSVNQRVVVGYTGNSSFGTVRVGTVSGTSISFGTAVVFQSSATNAISLAYNSNAQKVVIGYSNAGNSHFGTAIVGTVSGTSISFGTAVVFSSAATSFNRAAISVCYDASVAKVVVAYQLSATSNFIVGTVSGTSITFATTGVFVTGTFIENIVTSYDSGTQKVVISYVAGSSSVVFQNEDTNLTSENFIGFSNAAYTNGQTATIQIVGSVDDAQSGLTPGQSYYVQANGTISLTPGTPSVFAGTAVAATKIIVKG